MVWVVDTRQTLIVVIVGDELAFLRKVGSLLGQHIAERIISEAGDATCRMVHLSTAVTHVVSRGRHVALRVGDTNKALYAVILKRGGNLAVRSALLDGLQGLATAIGMGSLHIMECVCYGCNKCMTAVVNSICRSCRRVVRQCH